MSQFCTKCGAENRDEARFCHACGSALEEPVGEHPASTPQDSNVAISEPAFTEKEATFKEFFFSSKGRVGRKEYFFRWFMPYLSSLIVLTILSNVLQMQQVDSGIVLFANFAILLLLALFLMTQLFVGIKRLHDINASGWWSLLWLVPLANFVLLLVLLFKGTSTEASQSSGMKTGCYTHTSMRWWLFGMQLLLTIVLVPFLMLTNLLVKAEEKDQSSSISALSNKKQIGINGAGDLLWPAKQDKLFPFFVVSSDSSRKIGFINRKGDWLVKPTYDSIYDFKDGLARVEYNNSFGFIGEDGHVIDAIFSSAKDFSEGLAAVKLNDKWGFVDKSGTLLIRPAFDTVGDFSDGLAYFCVGPLFEEKCGFIDKQGNTVIQAIYDGASGFSEGLAAVKLNRKWGFIDKNNNFVIDPMYLLADGFKEGLASIHNAELKSGVIDKKGNIVIPPIYDHVKEFYDGFAIVILSDRSGVVYKNGNVIIQPMYDYTSTFIEGLAVATLNGRTGFLNKEGKWAIQPSFEKVKAFSEGLAAVKLNGKWGFIDKKGVLVIDTVYDSVDKFKDGFAAVVQNKQFLGYINKQGELVIQPKPYQP